LQWQLSDINVLQRPCDYASYPTVLCRNLHLYQETAAVAGFLPEDIFGGRHSREQAGPLNEAADDGKSGPRRVPNGGTLGVSDARWAEAHRRAAMIAPLAALESVSASAAREAGQTLGLSERTIYGLLRLWQRSGGLVTSLAPRPSACGRGKGRLSAAAEQFVTEAIRDEDLSKQKKRAEAVVRAVRDRCRGAGIAPPAANTVRARVAPGARGQGGASP
jgi:hypothetical protein